MPRPSAYPLKHGRIFGTVYDYGLGDVLEDHTHDATNNHITIITNGHFEVTGETKHSGRVLRSGEIVDDFEPGRTHGFKALSPGRHINLLIHDGEVSSDV